MIGDPITAMQAAVKSYLASEGIEGVEIDGLIGASVPWRPHIYQPNERIAWQLHSVVPESDTWEKRIGRAKASMPKLDIGVAATEDSLRSPEFLLACNRIGARIVALKEKKGSFTAERIFYSVPDLVCEKGIKLEAATAKEMLDSALERALSAKTKAQKGVTLELVVALFLSQVDNFEVSDVGISNRSQQMDVLVHNRSVGGMLGSSPLVLAEAKNWRTKKVTPTEHAHFLRKLQSRNRRAKLGFMVTTGKFTAGVALETRRESMSDTIVVLVDGDVLPTIWRTSESITKRVERLVIDASVGL